MSGSSAAIPAFDFPEIQEKQVKRVLGGISTKVSECRASGNAVLIAGSVADKVIHGYEVK